MAISFNEYLIKDALYFNLTCKHTRDRYFINDESKGGAAPFGSDKVIYLFDSSLTPYPSTFVDQVASVSGTATNAVTGFIYNQPFDSEITIDDYGTRSDVRDDKIYFNTVLFAATRAAKLDWFLIQSPSDRDIVTISDSIGIPGTNSLLTVSTSTVITGQAIMCWFNLAII